METNISTKRSSGRAERETTKETPGKPRKESGAFLHKSAGHSLPERLPPALPPGAVRWYTAALLTVLLLCLAAAIYWVKH